MPSSYQSSSRIKVRAVAAVDRLLLLRQEQTAIPAVIDARCDDPSVPFDLALRIAVDEHGVPVCSSLECRQRDGGPPVTKTGLTGLPLREVVAEAVRKAAFPVTIDDDDGNLRLTADLTEQEEVATEDVYAAFRRNRPNAAHRVTDEHLRKVAAVYQLATEQGDPAPTNRVAKVLYLTRPTAGRHVMQARKRGYLPPARPDKEGEQ